MSIHEILIGLENSALAHAVSKSNHMVGAGLQVIHVLGIVLLLAALILVSLRLLGLALGGQTVTAVGRDAKHLMWIGFVMALVSGVLMFISSPRLYYYNAAFQLKMVLFVPAVVVQFALLQRAAMRDSWSPALSRTSAVLALVLWLGVGMTGRVIGFL
jgi:hypothetical protein